ncbi:MAG TPA: adenylate/guanylate cyclase domain-containing protein [Leptospiraceae bacterium]|nr:adenylate/guanylate cyclase domain-containing protein [Leptospiraceae bacterium]
MHLDRLLEIIMDRVTSVMNAERSSLFLLDHKTDELYARVAQGMNVSSVRFPNGVGLAGHVGKTGQTINIADAYKDPRFNRDFDKKTGFRTRAILSMPIKNTRGKIIGVSQVLNKKGENEIFTRDDEGLLQAFSSIAAISLENALAYETINATMHTFEKFVPRRYLNSIAREGLESIRIGNAEKVDVSILFCDIRGFTTLSEKMKPEDVLAFLNGYLVRMGNPIAKNGGFVDKFIGDAIMAIFDTRDPSSAVRAGVGMLKELESYNRERRKNKLDEIKIGIGIHFGAAVLGTVGSEDRMDSTIIGDSVNLAARMEGLTKQYGCSLMITEDAASRLKKGSFKLREADTVRVKGKKKPIRIFDVFEADPAPVKKLKARTAPLLSSGITLYHKKRFEQALKTFEKMHGIDKKDPLASLYIERCKLNIKNGVPQDWDGSATLTEK